MRKIKSISVSGEYLARVIGYKDAEIIDIRRRLTDGVGLIEVIISHPDFPQYNEGDLIPVEEVVKIRT